MARFLPDQGWAGLDDAPGRNLRSPRAYQIQAAIRRLNHVAGRSWRLLFCQHYATAPGGSTDPMLRYRFNQNVANGRRLENRILFYPPFAAAPAPGTATPTIQSESDVPVTGNSRTSILVGTTAEPTDLRETYWWDNVTVGNVYLNRRLGTVNAFGGLASVAVYETSDQPGGMLDTANGLAIDPLRAPRPTSVIQSSLLAELRTMEDTLWTNHRPVVAAWCAPDFTNGSARSITGTTTPTNLIGGGTTAWTSTTHGEVCPAPYASRAAEAYVTARGYVYAQMSAATGTVTFTSSLNSVTAAAITTTAGWFATDKTLRLDSTGSIAALGGVEWDKVDIMGAPDNAANTIRVWAWGIQIEPT